ncbi:MAG: SDR family NAD(P)-dependent oxidoreductase [Lachnospiraceae bacterium]|jgi:short-subunit dehydrogenase
MKIALITGASSGMGREFARQIAENYTFLDEIWLIARRQEELEKTARQIAVSFRILPLNLLKEEDCQYLKNLLKFEKPFIKVLVNAAGFGKIGKTGDMKQQDVTGMIQLNAIALTRVTHMCLPYCGNKSRVIQLGSASAVIPQPNFAIYAASKSYVLSFSRALAREEKKRGITVTCVCPGPVKTEFYRQTGSSVSQISLLKRLTMASPDKVVRQAVRDAASGKELSIYGWPMKLVFVLCKLLPHKWILFLMGLFL